MVYLTDASNLRDTCGRPKHLKTQYLCFCKLGLEKTTDQLLSRARVNIRAAITHQDAETNR